MEVGKFYSVGQAAELLGCDVETVLAWIHSSELVAVDICKSMKRKRPTWRISEAELGRFLIARRNRVAVKVPSVKKQKVAPKQYV